MKQARLFQHNLLFMSAKSKVLLACRDQKHRNDKALRDIAEGGPPDPCSRRSFQGRAIERWRLRAKKETACRSRKPP